MEEGLDVRFCARCAPRVLWAASAMILEGNDFKQVRSKLCARAVEGLVGNPMQVSSYSDAVTEGHLHT